MRRSATITSVGFGLLLIGIGSAISAGLAKSGYLERVITSRNTGASSMQTEKMYWEGDRIRMERYSVAGLSVQIKNGNTLYMYSPAEKKAIKITASGKESRTVQDMLQMIAGSTKGGKKVGAGTVVGIKCDVYMIPVPGSKMSAKVYVSTDSRLPLPLKMQMSTGSGSQTIETRKLKLNYNVPDSMFSLPKGTKIEEKKLPQAPKVQPPAGRK